MMYRNSARLLLSALIVGAVACADSAGPAAGVTEAMVTRDVARDAAEATAMDLAEIAGQESLVGMPLVVSSQGSTSVFGNCVWDVAVSDHVCPAITTPEGLTLRRFFWIYDNDVPQRSFDAAATDSVLLVANLSGTLAKSDRTAWLSHSRLMLVTGLTGSETERTWRGDGSRDDSVHVQGDGVVRTTRMQSHDVFDHIVFKLPRATYPFPQSGTITHDVTVESTVPNGTEATNRTTARHVVVTFDGTQFASVMVGSTACRLDLLTRALSCQ